MNIKKIINSSDSKVDSMVKIQGTNYDRRRKVTKSMKHRMKQMYDSGKSYFSIAEHFGVSAKTVRYNLDETFRQYDIDTRKQRAKNNPAKTRVTSEGLAERASYKRGLMENKNFRRVAVLG